jgi:hypothetical protein
LLADKDLIQNAVNNSNDNHTTRIVKRGDEMEAREEKRAKEQLKAIHTAEYTRNRERVSEIEKLVKRQEESIAAKLNEDEGEEEEA